MPWNINRNCSGEIIWYVLRKSNTESEIIRSMIEHVIIYWSIFWWIGWYVWLHGSKNLSFTFVQILIVYTTTFHLVIRHKQDKPWLLHIPYYKRINVARVLWYGITLGNGLGIHTKINAPYMRNGTLIINWLVYITNEERTEEIICDPVVWVPDLSYFMVLT